MRNLFYNKKSFYFLFVSQSLMIVILYYQNFYLEYNLKSPIFHIILLLLAVSSYYFLYKILKGIVKRAQEDAEQEALIMQKKIQEEHYIAMKQSRKNIIEIKETLMSEALEDNNISHKSIEDTKNYINTLITNFHKTNKLENCENKIVDAILYNKALLAESKNVPFHVTALIPENINIGHIDLMCIFSNLLDNAIDANQKVKEVKRFVRIHAQIEANYLIVSVENAKHRDEAIKLERSFTSKEDKENHGLGLMIIKNTCEKYHGRLYIEDQKDTAILKAVLRIEGDSIHDK